GKGSDSSGGWGLMFYTDTGNTRCTLIIATLTATGVANSTATSYTIPSDFNISDNHHYALIVDFETDNLEIHIDGEPVSILNFGTLRVRLRGNADVYIGAARAQSSILQATSELSDYGLFERRLTNSEI